MVNITRHAVTWTVTGTPTVRTSVTGDPLVFASSIEITARTPAPTTVGGLAINGGMINPKHETSALNGVNKRFYNQGFDERCEDGRPMFSGVNVANMANYDAAKNAEASFPLTLSAGESLVSSVTSVPASSNLTGVTNTPTGDMSVLTVIAAGSDPGGDGLAFRPPYCGATKPLWLKSQVDYGKLPGLASPIADPTTGTNRLFSTVPATLERLNYNLHANTNLGINAYRPTNNMAAYPGDQALFLCQAFGYILCDFAGAEETYANRLIQIGIDNYAILQSYSGAWVPGAGFGWGFLAPILFAGWMLDDQDMMDVADSVSDTLDYYGNPIPTFQEYNNAYSSTSALSEYRTPIPRSAYPNGMPLYGDPRLVTHVSSGGSNHNVRDPAGKYDACGNNGSSLPYYPYPFTDGGNTWNSNASNYMQQSLGNWQMPVLASRLMGWSHLWKNQAVLDMADRIANDVGLSQYFAASPPNSNYFNYVEPERNAFRRDVHMFAGSGNGFCQQMWDTYRYPGGRKIIAF